MRHLELMRFLLVTSFTSQPDGRTSERAALTAPTGVSRSDKLHSVIPRAFPVPVPLENDEKQPRLFGRRKALAAFVAGGALPLVAFNTPEKVDALDMDAFMNKELEADTKNCDPKRDPKCAPQMTADEALCKYGQSGNARGEACRRVKAAGGELPKANSQGKSLGGAYAM
ncbi:hypothetical protein ACA910_012576 [Epithemia clementina (nom. ined.)]